MSGRGGLTAIKRLMNEFKGKIVQVSSRIYQNLYLFQLFRD